VWTGAPASAASASPPFTEHQPAPFSYTPQHLAEKILTSRSALEGERKQVTVLFCDLANSTALAEHIGPEAMHTLLNRFFELALNEVHRYEGTINQFLGDGFMALFGAPIAHEDHARRAVLAAVRLQRTLKEHHAELGAPSGGAGRAADRYGRTRHHSGSAHGPDRSAAGGVQAPLADGCCARPSISTAPAGGNLSS
jgi:class 3 adenylate cyclase